MEKNSFGALPIQRISKEAAIGLLRKAYAAGVTFYDTARYYTDSEEKVGAAFEGMRDKIYIATKTGATTAEGFWKDLHTSLEKDGLSQRIEPESRTLHDESRLEEPVPREPGRSHAAV